MERVTFKTNLKCGGCVAKIKPFLDALNGVEEWSVDLASPEKMLVVTLTDGETQAVIEAARQAGFLISEK